MSDGLLDRVLAIYRLDWSVFERIERDPHAIPQAFAIVVVISAIAGIGQWSFPLIFLWTAVTILQWVIATALIWAVGLWLADVDVDYARVLRCTGFAYAWLVLQLGSGLPLVGWIFAWSSIAMELLALYEATRYALEVDKRSAALICAVALGIPLLLAWTLAA